MKRNGKIIALAGVLCLCLVLTACYVAPDDVSNSTETNQGSNLPFQTLAPTATVTVTPDNVVTIETNVPGQPTPTPAPNGDNGWTNWGDAGQTTNPAGDTPVPSSGTIVFDNNTPVPGTENTIAVVTPTPATTLPR